MSKVGVDLALKAAEVVRTRNIALAIEMEDDDEEMDGLHAGCSGCRWTGRGRMRRRRRRRRRRPGADLPTAEQDPVDGTEQLGPLVYAVRTDLPAPRGHERHAQPLTSTQPTSTRHLFIHHQDIRRPLGLHRDIPADRMLCALKFARTAPTIRAVKRIRGLTLIATDLDWTTGSGPAAQGPAESLLMALAGRRDAVHELTSAGLPTLAGRIAA